MWSKFSEQECDQRRSSEGGRGGPWPSSSKPLQAAVNHQNEPPKPVFTITKQRKSKPPALRNTIKRFKDSSSGEEAELVPYALPGSAFLSVSRSSRVQGYEWKTQKTFKFEDRKRKTRTNIKGRRASPVGWEGLSHSLTHSQGNKEEDDWVTGGAVVLEKRTCIKCPENFKNQAWRTGATHQPRRLSEKPACILLLLSSCLSAIAAKTMTWTNNENIRTQRPFTLTRPRSLWDVWGAPGSYLYNYGMCSGNPEKVCDSKL